MAGKVTVTQVQLGDNAPATQNFVWQTNNDGTAKLARGNVGATTQDILTVDATGKVAFNQMPSPCFSAFQSVAQAIAANTLTKVAFQTKEFDVTTAYDSVTNFRFTPLVAGYYQVNANFAVATSVCTMYTTIYKNGAAYKSGCELINGGYAAVNAIVQMNGTTDYIEIFASASIGQNTSAIQNGTYFQASLVQRV